MNELRELYTEGITTEVVAKKCGMASTLLRVDLNTQIDTIEETMAEQ